jgi:hypothetical protein
MSVTRFASAVVVLLWLVFPHALFAAAPSDSPSLRVAAWVSTAGPYGPLWDLTLAPDGTANREILYPLDPSGELKGHFQLSDEALGALRSAVETERFFDLPAELAPAMSPLHMPDLRLEVWLGAKHHKVTLYSPEQIKRRPTTVRFLRVWNKLFGRLPVKPAW